MWDAVDFNPPIWLQFCSMAVDCPLDLLAKILGVSTSLLTGNFIYTFFVFTRVLISTCYIVHCSTGGSILVYSMADSCLIPQRSLLFSVF
jgi:hypothetical protein